MGYPRVVVLPFLLSLLFASSDGLITSSPSKVISFPRLQRLSVSLSNKNDKDSSNPKSASSSHNIPIWKKRPHSFQKQPQWRSMQISTPRKIARGAIGDIFASWSSFGTSRNCVHVCLPGIAMLLASSMNSAGVFQVLSQDSSQFVQNFLTVAGLLFSILVGQTYYFMYQQQEAVYYALFNEVTEAKSLVEQVALVCQGRGIYTQVLKSISQYVRDDLKNLQADPAVLLSARPIDDPLESVMYMTSVGVPSSVYETVRSLRQA
ncbi:hypothetical protein MHU86_24721 [Fragilaria crotonensis]|nr:hypothetical protein MHU86_24721 [Fragilaria crotonensis]